MKKRILIILLMVALGMILAACNSKPEAVENPNPVDAYPVPDDNPPDPGGAMPYPEPLQPAPVDPGFAVVPSDHEYAPQPGDENLNRGSVFIDAADLLLLESYPVQVRLNIKGSLPTPCNALRVIISPPDDQNQIHLEAYSLADPDLVCTQVLEPFEASLPLGSYTEGQFSVWINGEQKGEFNLP